MNISHDGDRVANISPDLEKQKEVLNQRIDIYYQPGGYDCSLPEIDKMVDIALENGGLGAQICGAGLGGSIMVLVENNKVDLLVKAMEKNYFSLPKINENESVLMASPIQGVSHIM